jgi:hypothetical protein
MKTFDARTANRWHKWLATHHDTEPEVWLIFYKLHTGVKSITYQDALDEALCFGWVDSLVKRIDDERFARKFTPRKPDSRWSATNRKRYAELQAAGRLMPSGIDRAPTDKGHEGRQSHFLRHNETHVLRTLTIVALFLGVAACERKSVPPPPPPPTIGDASKWTLTATGLGPLQVGMTVTEARAAAGDDVSAPDSSATAACTYVKFPSTPRGTAVMFEGGILARIEVREAGVTTAEGLEVGATAGRADSLYGASAQRRPHKYGAGEYLIVQPLAPSDTIHRLVIELVDGRVTTYRVGRVPAVEYVEGCS